MDGHRGPPKDTLRGRPRQGSIARNKKHFPPDPVLWFNAAVMTRSPNFERLLREVSRSFYLTLAIRAPSNPCAALPPPRAITRSPHGGGPRQARRLPRRHERHHRDVGQGRGVTPTGPVAGAGSPAGIAPIAGSARCWKLRGFGAEDRAEIAAAARSSAGQDADLGVRFDRTGPDRLATDEDGTTPTGRRLRGGFWTRLCLRAYPRARLDRGSCSRTSASAGLQMVSILATCPRFGRGPATSAGRLALRAARADFSTPATGASSARSTPATWRRRKRTCNAAGVMSPLSPSGASGSGWPRPGPSSSASGPSGCSARPTRSTPPRG